MGYQLTKTDADVMFQRWQETYDIFAPKCMKGQGCFSDTDVINYGKVSSLNEIEWEKRSDYSFKEALLPITETLFYFTEEETTVPKGPSKKRLVFLRACDLHGVKRLDDIYLNNGFGDFYYDRLRQNTLFVLMGCQESCETGFCVSMGTNRADDYDAYLKVNGDTVYADFRCKELEQFAQNAAASDVIPDAVTANTEKVTLPKHLSNETFQSDVWEEYNTRCIACGRCNFVCPTCSCFTMQDIYYKENENVGERRRVWASCQVDGYTEMAGGHGFRQKKSDRMRFKVMHKIYDYEKRFGYPMCVGCGRCDAICPEYISYANCVNRLAKGEERQ